MCVRARARVRVCVCVCVYVCVRARAFFCLVNLSVFECLGVLVVFVSGEKFVSVFANEAVKVIHSS